MSKDKKNSLSNEDFPLSAVPQKNRQGFWSLAVVLLGFTYYTGTMFAGGTIGAGFDFTALVWVIILGNLILGGYSAVLAWIAAKSGLTTALMARHSFGKYGARWVDFLLGFTQVGWYGWSTAMTATVFATLFHIPAWIPALIIFFGFAFCSTAFIGYKGIQWLSAVAVPAMTVLMVWSIAIALRDGGGIAAITQITPSQPMSFAAGLTVVVGTYISGGLQSTNWSRFAKSGFDAVTTTLLAFFIGNAFMIVSGALGAFVYQQADMVQVLVQQALLGFGIALLLLNIWTSQDNTIYSFSIAACTAFHTANRRMFVLIGAGIGTVIALVGIYDQLVPFLSLLGTIIPPVGGVISADYFIKHKKSFPDLAQLELCKFNWVGILSYIVGLLVAKFIPGIPPINGAIGALLAYPILDYLFKKVGYAQDNKIIAA